MFSLILFSLTIALGSWHPHDSSSFMRAHDWSFQTCYDDEKNEECLKNIARQPFLLLHKKPVKKVALLIHGLSDSPYFMKDIGKIFFEQGMNVVAICLSGHCTQEIDLHKANRQQWKEDAQWGLQQALKYGNKVILAGFSTGALLLSQMALQTPQAVGLALFSPAFRLNLGLKEVTCLQSHFARNSFMFIKVMPGEVTEYRYPRISNHAVCELGELQEEQDLMAISKNLKIPVFAALSEDDLAVSQSFVLDWMDEVKSAKRLLIYSHWPANPFIQKPYRVYSQISNYLDHAALTLEPTAKNTFYNPLFSVLKTELINTLIHPENPLPLPPKNPESPGDFDFKVFLKKLIAKGNH